ncbi:MAG: glutamate--tRNA ligase [Gammaproteobacteria bacterium RIFCSPLOWO2_12_FULL_47_76]|nr:MAG: glutamate--tRNA ligase [Gammaproteobacteria bacterium RIFCSPLOWO2_12_FULL_47_76]
MTEVVRTRFAPSPTGYLHIGGVRTALFSWLYARKRGGQFILRIEDTDRERSTDEAIQIILEGMQWLGLDYDEGPFYQSRRYDRYKEIIQQLIDEDHAYYCYCSKAELEIMRETAMARGEKPRYNGRCRHGVENPPDDINPVVRFKNPLEGEVIINDCIQGRVVYQNHELDDLIIARSDGTPTYNLTVVVDDVDMRITHVIRGDDHLNNTPRQMNIFSTLGQTAPVYAHVPLILGEDGKRLSKRHGAVSVLEYREQGYLPQALLNYLVRLGWSHGDQEIFSVDEMIQNFDIENVNKSAAAVNPDKLLWLNQHYLKSSPIESLVEPLSAQLRAIDIDPDAGPDLARLIEVQRERCTTLKLMAADSQIFFRKFDHYDPQAAAKHLTNEAAAVLEALKNHLESVVGWSAPVLHEAVKAVADSLELKLGKVAQPLRVALCGNAISPSIDVTLELLGRDKTLARIIRAIKYIHDHNPA